MTPTAASEAKPAAIFQRHTESLAAAPAVTTAGLPLPAGMDAAAEALAETLAEVACIGAAAKLAAPSPTRICASCWLKRMLQAAEPTATSPSDGCKFPAEYAACYGD